MRARPHHNDAHDFARCVAVGWICVASSATAQAQSVLPQGGTVVSGQAAIGAPTSGQLTINQTSQRAIVDWNSFSVGQPNIVRFAQPSGSSAILNRVTGSTPSTIAGQIHANGQVFLVNPNGIAITPSGNVQVGGGFVGSTLDISNADFAAGRLNFFGGGARLSNAGSLSVGAGGFIALLGGSVSNDGTIDVPLGRIGLGAGRRATLDLTNDGFLQVALPPDAMTADGRALVDVAGRISASGGTIAIKAATAQQAVRDAVNISGVLSAPSVSGRRGHIVIGGGEGGRVRIAGTVAARGGASDKGGTIAVTGRNIELRGALVDVSGGTGGGTVLIGGDARGAGDMQRAATTSVDAQSRILANATDAGDGGKVVVWSDDDTTFAGSIAARGGREGGNGGDAEVSGKYGLRLTGTYDDKPLADLSAAKGRAGTILFDPGTVLIIDQSTLAGNVALNGPDTFTAQFISSQLAFANVAIDTNAATSANGTGGDINLLPGANISWATANNLTLTAAGSINFSAGASIAGSGAGSSLTLRADSGGTGSGTINFATGTQVSLSSGTVDLYYNPASNRTPGNGGTNASAGTVNGTSFTGAAPAENWAGFISAGTLAPWMLVNSAVDLQNINNNLSARYAVGRDIDASATAGWNAGAGFVPLGTDGFGITLFGGFSGSFDGLRHTISNLTVNRPLADDAALIGYLNGGSVANVGITNASITGAANVGGLVGVNAGGSISESFSTGTVNAVATNAGGLVGWNTLGGTILNSYSWVDTSALVSAAGGLVGLNDGDIIRSYAAGPVASLLFSGGLVGINGLTGSVTLSYFDNQSSGQGAGVGFGSGAGITGLTTATLQNGSLPAGLLPATWTATAGLYPLLDWQIATSPPALTDIYIRATDPFSGAPVYGNATPAFGFAVTDSLGTVLCTVNCSAYIAGTPLISAALFPTTPAGAAVIAYIAQGTMTPQAGYRLRFVNDTMTVAQRPLTITALDQSKLVGTNLVLGTTAFSTSGLVNSDGVSGVTLASAGAGAEAATGPYAINVSWALGIGLANYAISYVDGVLTVTPITPPPPPPPPPGPSGGTPPPVTPPPVVTPPGIPPGTSGVPSLPPSVPPNGGGPQLPNTPVPAPSPQVVQPAPPTPPFTPTPDPAVPPVVEPMPLPSGQAEMSTAPGCATMTDNNPSKLRNPGCDDTAAKKVVRKIDQATIFGAIDDQITKAQEAAAAVSARFTRVVAISSVVLTAGFFGWLIQTGALLNALLASMPLWRQFDPLVVFVRPRRRRDEPQQPVSRIDVLFDNVRTRFQSGFGS